MTLSLDTSNPHYVQIRVGETIHRDEADAMKLTMVKHIAQHGNFSALVHIDDSFEGINEHSDWSDNDEDTVIQPHLQQLAIVGDAKWQDHALLFFLSGILPAPIKFFPIEQADLARAWLGDERVYATE
jgi:hypothetical protein